MGSTPIPSASTFSYIDFSTIITAFSPLFSGFITELSSIIWISMIAVILIILIVLWFLGYINISGLNLPNFILFNLNGRDISLWDVLILLVIGWAIGVLPTPLRQIAGVLLVIWVLATLGILAITGLAQIIVLAVIIGLVLALLGLV